MNNPPDVFTLAKNLGGSVVSHLVDGMKKVQPEEFDKRMSICKSCELFDAVSQRCNKCGCYLNIKASWNSEKCPVGKW